MFNQLKEKLWAFIVHNNPDLMFTLQEGYTVTTYLEDKVSKVMPLVMRLLEEGKQGHAIVELALEEMSKELRPSRFLYIKEVLQKDFPTAFHQYKESGVLTFECINLIESCKDVFEAFSFSEKTTQDNRLRHAVIARVHQYLS